MGCVSFLECILAQFPFFDDTIIYYRWISLVYCGSWWVGFFKEFLIHQHIMRGHLLTILPSLEVQKMVLFLCCKIAEKTQTHTGSDKKYPMSSMEEIEDWIEVHTTEVQDQANKWHFGWSKRRILYYHWAKFGRLGLPGYMYPQEEHIVFRLGESLEITISHGYHFRMRKGNQGAAWWKTNESHLSPKQKWTVDPSEWVSMIWGMGNYPPWN